MIVPLLDLAVRIPPFNRRMVVQKGNRLQLRSITSGNEVASLGASVKVLDAPVYLA